MSEEEFHPAIMSEAVQPDPWPQPPEAPPQRPRVSMSRWVLLAVIVVVTCSLVACGAITFFTARMFSASSATLDELRPTVEHDYPEYRIIDTTRQGFILQHETIDELRIDVRYFAAGEAGDWLGQPLDSVSTTWTTSDSFFRHAKGKSPDPRTGMTYDVAGFVKAYTPLKPGPNAVIMGVWLDKATSTAEFDIYYVLVARRNPGEPIWPDHLSVFSRLTDTGEWLTDPFEPIPDSSAPQD